MKRPFRHCNPGHGAWSEPSAAQKGLSDSPMSEPPGHRKALPFLLMAVVIAVVLGLPGASQVSAQAKSSETALEAQKLAWDDSLPGPKQPIPFSHAIHAGQYQIQCLYCHTGTDRSRMAGVP